MTNGIPQDLRHKVQGKARITSDGSGYNDVACCKVLDQTGPIEITMGSPLDIHYIIVG